MLVSRAAAVMMSLVVVACAGEQAAPARMKTITAREMGPAWPFTVASARLRCEDGLSIVLDADGRTYGLNGDARGKLAAKGWRDSRDIMVKTEYGGLPNVTDLIKQGQALCQ